MDSDLIKIINNGSNKKIISLQNNTNLEIIWYSKPFYIQNIGKIFCHILVWDSNNQNIYKIYNIPVESLYFFPIGGTLYQGSIKLPDTKKTYIEIESEKYSYMKYDKMEDTYKSFINQSIYGKLTITNNEQFLSYLSNEYFLISESNNQIILIPSFILGKNFYYPTSKMEQLFISQNFYDFIEKRNDLCNDVLYLKRRISQKDKITLSLLYLYYCFSDIRRDFSKIISVVLSKIKFEKEKKANFNFYFPLLLPKNSKLKARIYCDIFNLNGKKFIVSYDFDKLDLKSILQKDSINISYVTGISKKFIQYKIETSAIDEINSVSNVNFSKDKKALHYTSNNPRDNFEVDIEIKKLKPTKDEFRETNKVLIDKELSNNLISKGTFNREKINKNSDSKIMEKSEIDIKNIKEELEKLINKNIKVFSYLGFKIIFFLWKNRDVFILFSKYSNVGTYVISAKSGEISFDKNIKNIIREIINIKQGATKKTLNQLSFELMKQDICFHTTQKSVGKLKDWIDRLIRKIEKIECKQKTKK